MKMNFTILRFDSVGSTNTEALNQAKQGANEGLCIVAKQQTQGRGRHGRTWLSEKDAGLYLSLVLRPRIENKFLPLITLMSAIAVYDALRKLYRLEPDIKWANDVHINGKKIGGILAEMGETKKGLAVIVGIGINLNSKNFSPELVEIATSIEEETNHLPNTEDLLQTLTHFLSEFYEQLKSDGGGEKIRREWTRRSTYAFGKQVRVKLSNETLTGTTCGIEESGALRVQTESGEIKIVQAGDVESLRQSKGA
jgi:BirA family biotin operon repressor/biotin-[acetyl-CoA-carboxylase] ligase